MSNPNGDQKWCRQIRTIMRRASSVTEVQHLSRGVFSSVCSDPLKSKPSSINSDTIRLFRTLAKPDWCSRRALGFNRLFGHHSSPITIIYPTVENCSNCSWSFGATRDSSRSRTPAQSARADPVSVAAAVALWINKMSQPAVLWWGQPLGHLDLPAVS